MTPANVITTLQPFWNWMQKYNRSSPVEKEKLRKGEARLLLRTSPNPAIAARLQAIVDQAA